MTNLINYPKKNARHYEFNRNRKAIDSGSQFSWWGHAPEAAQVACIFQEPKKAVTMHAPDGATVRFSKNDIQGLLVLAIPSLVNKIDFRGQRYHARDWEHELHPDEFLQALQEWSAQGLAFVIDINRNEQVWSFPYDKITVSESHTPPQGFSNPPEGALMSYYHIEISSTGFDHKNRVYDCFIEYGVDEKTKNQGWSETLNKHTIPRGMWCPYPKGDLTNKSSWRLDRNNTNPEIDMGLIFDIYMGSLF